MPSHAVPAASQRPQAVEELRQLLLPGRYAGENSGLLVFGVLQLFPLLFTPFVFALLASFFGLHRGTHTHTVCLDD